MQAEQCFAVAHKMDRKSIWPVLCRRMAHAGLPLGGAFRLRISNPVKLLPLPVPLRFGGPTLSARQQRALGMMNSGNGCLGASAGASIG
jgi:hypothetical protein